MKTWRHCFTAGVVQQGSADNGTATDEASQPCREEENLSGSWAVPANTSVHGCLKERPQEDGVCGLLTGKGRKPGNAFPKCCHFAVPLRT